MPFVLRKQDGKWCVYSTTSGKNHGCHSTRAQAIRQQRALYVNVPEARTASMDGGDMTPDLMKEQFPEEIRKLRLFLEGTSSTGPITAAAAPLKPPREWFDLPEAEHPTPLTFTAEGKVYGHLALWGACHTGFLNGALSECVQAPRSQTNYGSFHLGSIETQEGDLVPIGKLTFDTNHAPLTAGLPAASRHYDETGSVGAFVRARDGKHGIWLSGAVRSDLSPEGLRDLRANPPSGDWRALNHNLELIASLAVPVPGFPVPRAQFALAASANGDTEVDALILPGFTIQDYEGTEEMAEEDARHTPAYLRQRSILKTRAREALAAAVLTAKKRKSLPRSSFAIPERRAYPIHDRAHAQNALARSAGKPEAARVRRAVCRRFPDMCRD